VKVAAVILAAGPSERMGGCKALLKFGGETAMERISRQARAGGADSRIVAVGAKPHLDPVKDEAQRLGLGFVENREPWRGRTSSIILGITAVRDSDAAFIAPVDCPVPDSGVYASLKRALDREAGSGEPPVAAVPEHSGRGGHPVLVSRRLFPTIAGLRPETPLREVFRSAGGSVSRVAAPDSVLLNVDSPEAYQKALDCLRVKEAA
jgi:CTP:molybdopterin cytidylyltransferase MocA